MTRRMFGGVDLFEPAAWAMEKLRVAAERVFKKFRRVIIICFLGNKDQLASIKDSIFAEDLVECFRWSDGLEIVSLM